jgi:two-component system OmpR family response regulator
MNPSTDEDLLRLARSDLLCYEETRQFSCVGVAGNEMQSHGTSRQQRDVVHIVVVDDDPAIRATLRDCLEPEGYRVSEAANKTQLFATMDQGQVDLITLDLKMLPDDGLSLAREIRERSDVPIIMVTSKADPLDRIVGLEIGADDYIVKPFHVREVLARVRSVLRRYQGKYSKAGNHSDGGECFVFDRWTLDCRRRRVESDSGKSCALTTAEFNLLKVLLTHANRVLTRNQIMDLMKGQSWVANDRAVDNQVGRLRRKLESIDGASHMIQSVRGAGYMMTADVTRTP